MVLAKLHFSFLDWRDSGKYGILVLLGQAFQWLGIPGISSLQFSRSGNKWDSDLGGCCCSVTKLCLTLNPWTAARQATLSFTISQSLLKFMSIESVMLSKRYVILCRFLLLLPSVFPSIKVFSNESALPIRWPKYWSFNSSIGPSCEYSGLIFL